LTFSPDRRSCRFAGSIAACGEEKIHQCLQRQSILAAFRIVAEKLAKVVKFAGIKAD
jgi:hypothetical protein